MPNRGETRRSLFVDISSLDSLSPHRLSCQSTNWLIERTYILESKTAPVITARFDDLTRMNLCNSLPPADRENFVLMDFIEQLLSEFRIDSPERRLHGQSGPFVLHGGVERAEVVLRLRQFGLKFDCPT